MIETTHVYEGGRLVDVVEVEVEQQPLDRDAQLVALLAAKGVITPKEASDLTGYPSSALAAEVEAWSLGLPKS